MKIVLAGPPRSGKSCLREGLKQAILTRQRNNSDIPYPYVITACLDGEGHGFKKPWKNTLKSLKRAKRLTKANSPQSSLTWLLHTSCIAINP